MLVSIPRLRFAKINANKQKKQKKKIINITIGRGISILSMLIIVSGSKKMNIKKIGRSVTAKRYKNGRNFFCIRIPDSLSDLINCAK